MAASSGSTPASVATVTTISGVLQVGCQGCAACQAVAGNTSAIKAALASSWGLNAMLLQISTALSGCSPRRLEVGRILTSSPGVAITYTITGTASAISGAQNALTGGTPQSVAAAIQTTLTNALSLAGLTVANVVAPTISQGFSGYSACYEDKACWFSFYTKDVHYKIHSTQPGFSRSACAAACSADSDCEAFETLENNMVPSCSFWLAGACDIRAQGSNPPGYVDTNVNYAYFCDKTGNRATFVPKAASRSFKSCILSRSLITLVTLLMVAVVG